MSVSLVQTETFGASGGAALRAGVRRSTAPGDDAGTAMGERIAAGGGLAGWLSGRQTYEGLLAYQNGQGGPFRLFPADTQVPLRLINSVTSASGVLTAAYEPSHDRGT